MLYFKKLLIFSSYFCGIALGNILSSPIKIIAIPIAIHAYSMLVSVLCECPTTDFSIAKTNEEIGVLNENVNPNIIDDKGNSALIWAIKRNNQNIVKMLIEKNAIQKYNYYEAGRKRVMRACDVAREMTALSTTSETKKSNSDIKAILGCSLWPF